jgi:hypothetical protein
MEGAGKSSRGRPRKIQAISHDAPAAVLNGHHNEVPASFDANGSSSSFHRNVYGKRDDSDKIAKDKKIVGEIDIYEDDEEALKPPVDDEEVDEGGSEGQNNKNWWGWMK